MRVIHKRIGAVVLAAGLSSRMRSPKLLLPWGTKTVIEQVVSVVLNAGVSQVVVVTGKWHTEIDGLLTGLPVQVLFNSGYEQGEMIDSMLFGLDALDDEVEKSLIVLGDQPQIRGDVIKRMFQLLETDETIDLLVPSYQMRRGHPWLVGRRLWPELRTASTPRQFLHNHADKIVYLEVEDDGVLQDLDTPEDYERYRRGDYHKEDQ
jgi:molybdenum cofactor cytidylyltransferase